MSEVKWEVRKLGDFFNITSSKRVFKKDWTIEGVPFYRAREIVQLAKKGFVKNELFISDEMFNEYSEKFGFPKHNDIMVTGVGTLGVCYVVKEGDKFYFKDGSIIWLQSLGSINSRFVEYAFQSNHIRNQLEGSVGATVGTYTIIRAKNTKINVPSLPEQQRIVSLLDEAFESIDQAKTNAEKNVENAKELFESYLQSVFETKGEGWEDKKLGDIVNTIMTGPFGSMLHKSDYVDDGIPVINPQNLVDGHIIPLSKTMIDQATHDRLKKYALKLGDIVIARRGEMGRCAVVKKENVNWLCGTGSFVIRVDTKKVNSDFLNIILSSDSVKQQLEASSIGATMNNLNQTILSGLHINIPPVGQQQSIVDHLENLKIEIDMLKNIYSKRQYEFEELRKSILEKAFNGEL